MLRHRQSGKRPFRAHYLRISQVVLALATAGYLCFSWVRVWHGMPNTQLEEPTALGVVDDVLLGSIVQKCIIQQSTTIMVLDRQRKQVAAIKTARSLHKHLASATCPLVIIPLAEDDRSIGLCTDAALYVQVYGGRIVPDTQAGLQQAQACAFNTAVLFLEPLYDTWISWLGMHPQVVAIFAPNYEHVFDYDREAHKRMQLILCKVYVCNELMDAYLDSLGSNALLLYTGHTSTDALTSVQTARTSPSAACPTAVSAAQPPATAAKAAELHSGTAPQSQHTQPAQPSKQETAAATSTTPVAQLAASAATTSALHIRGKSSLKHTKQLLECWLTHPEWPQLVVIGPMPNEQITLQETKQYLAAGNIQIPRPGKQSGPGWPLFDPVSASELSCILRSHPIHIMPSEREGFGHTINEGCAAGALLVVPDHPPMNELVLPGSGVLIRPTATFSHKDDPVPALGKYANISVSVSPESICEAVAYALSISHEQRVTMGARARRRFDEGRKDFEQRAIYIRSIIKHMVAAAVNGSPGN